MSRATAQLATRGGGQRANVAGPFAFGHIQPVTYFDPNLLETLLRGAESTTLDFKRQQYPLSNSEEKGELIKDILALANAWKTSDAHILIGVVDGQGGRATLVGGVTHYDDANLQQLVNSKTNRPVVFAYIPILFEGEDIAVIRIDKMQQRPLFLTKKCGRTEADLTYARQGSSTHVAGTGEIEKMVEAARSSPLLTIGLRPRGADVAAPAITVYSTELREQPSLTSEERAEMRKMEQLMSRLLIPTFTFPQVARPYYGPAREKIREYVLAVARLCPVRVEVTNHGQAVVNDVRVELRTGVTDAIDIRDERPERPRGRMEIGFPDMSMRQVWVEKTAKEWSVEVAIRKIQPGTTQVSDPFWIGALSDVEIRFAAVVSGDELSKPIRDSLAMKFEVEKAAFGSLEEAESEFDRDGPGEGGPEEHHDEDDAAGDQAHDEEEDEDAL